MSLAEQISSLISSMEEIVSAMRYVKPKDEVRAEDTNLFVNFTKKAAELIKKVYELYKLKTGERLLLVEEYISIAETRARFLKEVKTLDIIHPDDHNLIIDTLKPIELALMEMEKRLEARTS